MEDKMKKILQICIGNRDFEKDYSPENSLFNNLSFLFDGGHQGDKGNQELDNYRDNLADLKKLSEKKSFAEDATGLRLNGSNLLAIKEIKEEIATSKIVNKSLNILPNSREKADSFSAWCEQELIGGARPAVQFWNNWKQLQKDPLSLFLTGKTAIKQTQSDDEKGNQEDYFVPDLTGSHINVA